MTVQDIGPRTAGEHVGAAAARNDTLSETRDADFILADASLTIGAEGADTLSGVESAELSGGGGDNVLDASAFTGTVALSGEAGDDTFALASGEATVAGGDGSDTLAAGDSENTWMIDGLNTGFLNGSFFESIENLLGGAIEDSFMLAGGAMITGLVDGRQGQDRLKGDASADYTWDVTALNEGQVKGISFADFEFLEGGAGNKDTFVIAQDAGVSGTVEGGDAGYDTVVLNGDYAIVSSVATDDDAGILTLDGVDLVFDGMEPVVFNGGLGAFVYDGSNSGDNITVSAPVAMVVLRSADRLSVSTLMVAPVTSMVALSLK